MPVLKKAAGLHTFNNEINEREGALDVADNIVIDAEDTIQSRRGFGEFGNTFGTGSDNLNQIFEYKDRILRHYNSTLQFDSTGQGAFSDFSGSYNEIISGLRIKSQESNSNLYFTTNDGIKKISAASASDFTTGSGYITDAGGIKGLDVTGNLTFSDGGFLEPQSKCAYRVVWGIKDNNNNLILGSPSARLITSNTTQRILTPEEFTMFFSSGTKTDYDGTVDNRYVLFNSLTQKYFIWFSTSANPDIPVHPDLLDRVGIEVDIESYITATDIATATGLVLSNQVAEFDVEVVGDTVTMTSVESGEDLVDASSSTALTAVTTTVIEQGAVIEDSAGVVELTITVPTAIDTTDYFYQVYRSPSVTATTGIDLADLDPGDEMRLVFEANITGAEITAKEVVITDETSEEFRDAGAFLYTNPNTGEGILQANERPPVAQDIELFRNSTFYANTQTLHRLTLNLLAVADFTSGVSDLIIGNSSAVSEFVFVGATEVSTITTDSYANTDDTGYILLNSASDEREYYIWMDKGITSDPAISGRVGVRVEIESGDTDADVATKTALVIDQISDFIATSSTDTVTITNDKNGNTTNISMPVDLTNNWAVGTSVEGDGEDAGSNEVLLSSEASIGLSIDETARSLVRIINKDVTCPVNAFYLSGVDDLPGIILLEAKSLADGQFYVSTSDTAITTKFTPELSPTETITAISVDNPTEITSAGHGLVTGEEIYVYDTDSGPTFQGKYSVTVLDANTFTVPVEIISGGTAGIWFRTFAESDNEVASNRLYYSKVDQPEAVPLLNYINIGPQDKSIQRILALRDNLVVMKEDGIYLVTGSSAPDFGSRLLDASTQIIAPDSAVVLNNRIYALTTQGVVTISEGGVSIISRAIEDKILEITNVRYDFTYPTFGVAYESDRSYILYMPSETTDTYSTQAYRYNTFTRTWTRWTNSATCGLVSTEDILYIGPADRNYIDKERKVGDRTDYSDRDFTLTISASGVNGSEMTLSSVLELTTGDVLVQTQYLTISQYNRLLKRLDLDGGLDDVDYFSSLQASQGDNMTNKMTALNTKLEADDSSGTVTSKVYSNDFVTLQTEFNDLMVELNSGPCDTIIKDYDDSIGTAVYEEIVLSTVLNVNKATVTNSLPFIEGPVQAYKAISTTIQWAPQHFGASDLLKQVREGTVIFDQNNFYSGTISYASDRSASFESIPFPGQGVGFWGGGNWGELTWGGLGNEIPTRTLIPRDKQRCRHIKVKFQHNNAREVYKVLGISLEPRSISKRAYR